MSSRTESHSKEGGVGSSTLLTQTGGGEFFFWPVLTTPPDKDPKTVCNKKVEQPFRGFLSKTTLQKAIGMFLLATHTLES